MGKIPAGIKLEKVCSKDGTRPILTVPAVVEWDGGKAIAATDSYKLAIIPLEDSEGLEVGPIDLDLVKAAVKSTYHEITSAGGATDACKTRLTTDGRDVAERQNHVGQFPNVAQLMPPEFTGGSISFSARYLLDLVQGMGAGPDALVRLDFIGDTEGRINPLRPMRVTVSGKPASDCAGRVGLLMPIRIPDGDATR